MPGMDWLTWSALSSVVLCLSGHVLRFSFDLNFEYWT